MFRLILIFQMSTGRLNWSPANLCCQVQFGGEQFCKAYPSVYPKTYSFSGLYTVSAQVLMSARMGDLRVLPEFHSFKCFSRP